MTNRKDVADLRTISKGDSLRTNHDIDNKGTARRDPWPSSCEYRKGHCRYEYQDPDSGRLRLAPMRRRDSATICNDKAGKHHARRADQAHESHGGRPYCG